MALLAHIFGVTGEGSSQLDGGSIVSVALIDSFTRTIGTHASQFSWDEPIKLAHVGWIGLTQFGAMPPYESDYHHVMLWFDFQSWQYQEFAPMVMGGPVPADTIAWSVGDSVLELAVYSP